MIKINLLPSDEQKKSAPVSAKPILAGLGVVAVLAGLGYGWYWYSGLVDEVRQEIVRTQAELKRVEEIAKLVDKLQKDKKLVEDKIKVIDTLVMAQSGPVRLLDEISRALPSEVWLTNFARTGKKLEISGIAFSNFHIATFMTNLGRAGELIGNVDLLVSEKAVVEQVPVERFSISVDLKG